MPSPDQRLGEYLLIERIGGGAFGEVWRARHHAWAQRVVAVKIPSGPFVRQLQLEGAALRRLDHPNIVKPLAFDPFADPPYLVMEYVAGGNLRHLIRRGPMPPGDAASVLAQILSALGHAHEQGVIHRDIKPENVLICGETTGESPEAASTGAPGVAKVTDFGLGKAVGPANLGHHSIILSQDQRADGSVVGSTGYMAPEQLDGGEVDARADLYACGVLLFEMLTGQRPAGVELPGDLNPAVPPAFDEVFRRAFTRRERRFATAGEFAVALAAAAGPAPRPPPLAERALAGRPPVGPARAAALVAVAVAIVGVIIGTAPRQSAPDSPAAREHRWLGDRLRPTSEPTDEPETNARPGPGPDSAPAVDPSPGPDTVPTITPPPNPPAPVPPAPPPVPEREREKVIEVVNRTDAREAEEVVQSLSASYPDALKDVKVVELVKVHDASDMRRHAGGPERMDGSFSRTPVIGRNNFIMLWGIYEELPAGRYLVAYRLQSPAELSGDAVCFLDVCHTGTTVAGLRPPAGEVGHGRWSVIPVALDLNEPTEVEYRLWPHDHVIALDRVYVFRLP